MTFKDDWTFNNCVTLEALCYMWQALVYSYIYSKLVL